MSTRRLGLSALILIAVGTAPAAAAISTNPTPIVVTVPYTTPVNTTGMATATLTDSALNIVDLAIEPACTGMFTVTPNAMVDLATPQMITVTFTAEAKATIDCNVEVTINGAGTSLGTFPIRGVGQAAELTISTVSPVTFASVRHLDTAATPTSSRSIALTNTGDLPLTISGLAISGTHAADYAISSPSPGFMIAATETVNVVVVFNPSAVGVRTASLDVTSDDPVMAGESAVLSGTGTTAVIAVTDAPFGIVTQGTSSTLGITASNSAATNPGPLAVTGAAINQTSTWFSFAASNGCVAGATTCTLTSTAAPTAVQVRCQPPAGATGTQVGSVAFTSDTDPSADTSGALSCTAGRADVSIDQATLTFGDQRISTTSAAQIVMISNTGNQALSYAITKLGANPGQFNVAMGCTTGCTLAASTTTAIMVNFAPTTIGPKAATVRISSNDPDDPTVDISVTGTGVAPRATATPTSLSFSTVDVGQSSATMMVTVTNTGGANLQISSASISALATDYQIPSGTLTAQTLAPSQTATWQIQCTPTTHGARNGTFRVVSDSDLGANLDVPLTCTGQQGLLTINPTSHNFGGVAAGTIVTRDFTLANPGNLQVANITAVLSDATVGYSILTPTFPLASLAGNNGSVTVRVQFAPLTAADGGPITITFAGTWGGTTTVMAVLSIDGDGLTVGYDVTPATLAFGDMRWDTTATLTFCIVNTSQAAVSISQPTLTLAGGTMTGEIAFVEARRRLCGATGGTLVNSWPQVLNSAQAIEVVVRADPADRTGALGATITINSDLATNPMRMVTVTANSITAMLSTTPGLTVDFGAVDLQAGPATQMVTITNTGAAALNLGAFSRVPATGGPFTLTLPGAQVLAPGGNLVVPVTYTPTVERAPNQNDTLQLTHSIAGVLNGPSMQMISIIGRGIDRHLALDPAPMFPDTFRNPGSAAPVLPVRVTNTGEATLRITAVMLSNDPVWQLVDNSPVDVAGGQAHEFPVRFAPTVAGMAPTGTLALMNDDDAMPMAVIDLNGLGRDRSVSFGDPILDLGNTGIGIPVTLTGALPVISMDPSNTFTVRSIELIDGAAFTIHDSPVDVALSPSGTLRYDVTFTPDTEGEFRATARLYLDEDPQQVAEVTIVGRAVFVDLGGGGCAISDETPGGAAVVLLALLVVVGGRRRRRPRRAIGLLGATLVGAMLLPGRASAQANLDLDLSLFNPTPSTTGHNFQLQSALVGDDGMWAATATASLATNPLVMRSAGTEHLSITRRSTLELGGAYAFLDRFEAGARLPLYSQDGDGTMLGVASPSGTARGDLVVHARAKLWRSRGASTLAFGAGLQVTVPTASEQQFAGTDGPGARVIGLATLTPAAIRGRLTLTANLGAVIRAKSKLANIEQGSGVMWGAGASFRVLDALWATAETYGDVVPGGRRAGVMAAASTLSTAEFLVGASYRAERRVSFGVAVGRGIIAGPGTPDVRGVFTLAIVPGTAALPPIFPPPPPKIDGDADGDGIKDSEDKCPELAEDLDQFDDSDGCPDTDNDHDAFADADDKCPLDPEDVDGFEDEDGCPDKDNDGDGIPDASDRCPLAAEDKDGFDDLDGCPELDNDRDGIPDAEDKCPAAAETINGNDDNDGCPDRGDELVLMTPSGLETLEAIQFRGATLAKSSTNVLGQIAATLRAHPEIIRIKIVAHVHPSRNPDRDRELTQQRAIAVRQWLIDWGIAATRLSGAGAGGTKPIAKAGQRNAAQLDERIELIILERK